MRRARSSPMLGTSKSYITFTLKLPSFVHIFISKAIKKCSLLVVLSRIDPDPLAGSEASFLYNAIRARPNPTTGRARWGEPPKSQEFFLGGGGTPQVPIIFPFLIAFLKKTPS
jgi:hypothetical protein